jgi:hypothetical protein
VYSPETLGAKGVSGPDTERPKLLGLFSGKQPGFVLVLGSVRLPLAPTRVCRMIQMFAHPFSGLV